MRMNRRRFLQGTAGAAGALATGGCSPPPSTCGTAQTPACSAGLPDGSYFQQLAEDLNAAGIGTPQIFIDLDRLDANADAIAGTIGASRYRIVEKSLPSL